MRTRVAALLLFGSGFCALIYQTTWLREFRLIFGASTAASAAVLGVFMAGLGFGGIVLGRRSENKARPLAFYAQLELFIALSAALSPLLIVAARYIYIALGGTAALGMTLGTVVRLIIAGAILGVPTFLMGGTLPAVARAAVGRDDVSRRALGVLYGVNTLGAVTGALAGTFYLFENFGNRMTLWWAAVLNVAVALLAFRCSKSFGTAEPEPPNDPRADETTAGVNRLFVFIAAGLVGFAFFLMEMVWYRMLAPLLGGSTFTFGLILAVALLGIGLGGLVYALFELKQSASLQFFALTCAAEAFFIALPFALGDRIAIAAMLLRPLGTLGFYGHVMAWSALCTVVIFPAAFISGLQFPLLIALLGKGRKCVGSQTGTAYAWNTIGALLGSLAGGFGFIPMFSAVGVWKIVVGVLVALAFVAACWPSAEPRRWFRPLAPFAIGASALFMLTTTGPTAFWRHSQIGVGGLRQYHASPNQIHDLVSRIRRRTLWQEDGRESSVAVANADSIAFIVNGKSDGNAKADAGTQIMSGMVGATLHPNPQKALVIGLGSGSTAGWLAAVPTMQRVDAVELERAMLKVAKQCAPVNRHVLENPKVHVTIGDGREILLTTREHYDLVASEPSNPYRAGVAGLFTREFYQSVENRLNPNGIFLQWVQTYDVDDRTIEIFYRTLASVFPNIETWQTQEGDLLLIASREPIPYQVDALRQRLEQEPFKSALAAAWRGHGLEDFLAHYVGDSSVAKSLQNLQEWPLNTDDRTVIEFAFARSVSTANGFQMANLRSAAQAARCDRPKVLVGGAVDWARVDEGRLSAFGSVTQPDHVDAPLNPGQQARAVAQGSYMRGDLPGALRAWRAQPDEPKTLSQLALVAEGLASEGDNGALRYIDQLAQILPSDAQGIRALLYWKRNTVQEATETLMRFFDMAQTDPWPDQDLIRRSIVLAGNIAFTDPSRTVARRFYEKLQTPFCVWNAEAERALRLVALGKYLDGDASTHVAAAIEAIEPNVLWDRKFLEVRRNCYQATADPRAEQATRDLDEFMTNDAFTADVSALARVLEAHGSGAYATEFRPSKSRD